MPGMKEAAGDIAKAHEAADDSRAGKGAEGAAGARKHGGRPNCWASGPTVPQKEIPRPWRVITRRSGSGTRKRRPRGLILLRCGWLAGMSVPSRLLILPALTSRSLGKAARHPGVWHRPPRPNPDHHGRRPLDRPGMRSEAHVLREPTHSGLRPPRPGGGHPWQQIGPPLGFRASIDSEVSVADAAYDYVAGATGVLSVPKHGYRPRSASQASGRHRGRPRR